MKLCFAMAAAAQTHNIKPNTQKSKTSTHNAKRKSKKGKGKYNRQHGQTAEKNKQTNYKLNNFFGLQFIFTKHVIEKII